ncbi:hypothetical protein HMPREF0083_02830 [Aneurinibacillus aneurinilyticus ATCC 12856]|uniref:Uncharacterized protein n=1 Tax=Aneurinibacillus aneurinilyticus ATCC 12856 TaxID=649747 RepID=U1YA79_ANEAE|nr:hypothetical protein HMPREF0083_02830 [Aneurinibacillus aneurinilyticus ATCC 12856]
MWLSAGTFCSERHNADNSTAFRAIWECNRSIMFILHLGIREGIPERGMRSFFAYFSIYYQLFIEGD